VRLTSHREDCRQVDNCPDLKARAWPSSRQCGTGKHCAVANGELRQGLHER
jgi:hypothetical protein